MASNNDVETRSQERRTLDAVLADERYHAKKIDGTPRADRFVDLPWIPREPVESTRFATTLGDFVDGTAKLVEVLRSQGARQTSVAHFWHNFGSAGGHAITIVRTSDQSDGDGRYRFVVISGGVVAHWTYAELLAEWPRELIVYVEAIFPPLSSPNA